MRIIPSFAIFVTLPVVLQATAFPLKQLSYAPLRCATLSERYNKCANETWAAAVHTPCECVKKCTRSLERHNVSVRERTIRRDWRVLVRGSTDERLEGAGERGVWWEGAGVCVVVWGGEVVQYSTNRSSCRMNIRCGSVSLPDDDTEAAVAVTSIAALIILKYYGGATVVDETGCVVVASYF